MSATSTKTLLAATTQTSFTDTGVGFKEAYTYDVLACRNANDPDTACFGSGPLEPFVVLANLSNGNLYGLATPQVDSAVLAADFGLGRVGARWAFADPDDSTQTPTLDYTVRQLTSAGARVSLTALNRAGSAGLNTQLPEIGGLAAV